MNGAWIDIQEARSEAKHNLDQIVEEFTPTSVWNIDAYISIRG